MVPIRLGPPVALLYALLALCSGGVHLLELAAPEDCPACDLGRESALHADCAGPCSDSSHSHHNHPVRVHEDGCLTCKATWTLAVESSAVVLALPAVVVPASMLAAGPHSTGSAALLRDRSPPAR